MILRLTLCAAVLVCMSTLVWSKMVTADEMAEASRWADKPQFSFVYDGHNSNELLRDWTLDKTSRKLDKQRTERTLTWTDPKTGLVVRCVAVEYSDFPSVEWTIYLKNNGTRDTPIISDLKAIDIALDNKTGGEFLLHHATGSPANGSDYGPLETPLGPGTSKRFGATGGRPNSVDWSYFNLEWGGRGMIVAIGWPGQWSAEFVRDQATRLQLRAGQEVTHFTLHPGEEVRSPLVQLQFWQGGDWIASQNVWRRWMKAHGMPRPGGKLPKPMLLAHSGRTYTEMINATEENQKMFIGRYLEEGIKIDYWWMDAGWYANETENRGAWPLPSYYDQDYTRFPNGIRAISDYAHSKGVKTLLWFEPETIYPGTWLTKNHPDWLLGNGVPRALNLGNPVVLKWCTNNIDKILKEQDIDLYRQDFNQDPLAAWRYNEPEDRQGITENHYVRGYLAFWDELQKRHPNMLIDSCASGGRRNEPEAMKRAVPLWRSDCAYEPIAQQCMAYGISFWLPYQGTGTTAARDSAYYDDGRPTSVDEYAFWSTSAPSMLCSIDIRDKQLDYSRLRKLISQWRQINKYYYGDFYPLTPWSRENNVWIGWQYDVPESGEGMVQMFRRSESNIDKITVKLRGLESKAQYAVRNVDSDKDTVISGYDLIERGLSIEIPAKPGVAVITYKKVK